MNYYYTKIDSCIKEVLDVSQYIIRFWFEHGGTCLWSVNEKAKARYGYAIDHSNVPISNDLVSELDNLESLYIGYLDWEYPPNPSPWTSHEKGYFINKANIVHKKLIVELGEEFEVINDLLDCVK